MAPPRIPGYAVQALLGRGGMGEVWRARVLEGPRAGRRVALKLLLPGVARDTAHLQAFAEEAILLLRLEHPHIVQVLDTGMAEDGPFIAMEYVDGRNLRQILTRCGERRIFLPLDFAAYLAHVLALALDHAHRATDASGRPLHIVHCDVSPQNVFISRMGEVKLGDFGVARAAGEGAARAYGKVRYLAPEQLRGEPVGPRTDVFALGALLYEMLANEPAFPGPDPQAVATSILSGARRVPSSIRPEVPFALDEVVLRALGPHDRLESAAEFAAMLRGRWDPNVGTDLGIASAVRVLFGAEG